MKDIKVQTKFDFKALKTANMYVLRVKRKSFITYIIISLLCLGGVVYTLIAQEDMKQKIIFSILFGIFALFSIFNLLTEEKKVEKSLKKFFTTNPPMKQYVSLSEEKLVLVVPNGDKLEKISYDWAFVQEIIVLNEYVILFMNGGVPVLINRNEECYIEGSPEELLQLLEEKGALKPYRVYTKDILKNFNDPIAYIETEDPLLDDVLEKFNSVEEEKTNEQEEVKEENLLEGNEEVKEEDLHEETNEEVIEEKKED